MKQKSHPLQGWLWKTNKTLIWGALSSGSSTVRAEASKAVYDSEGDSYESRDPLNPAPLSPVPRKKSQDIIDTQ